VYFINRSAKVWATLYYSKVNDTKTTQVIVSIASYCSFESSKVNIYKNFMSAPRH